MGSDRETQHRKPAAELKQLQQKEADSTGDRQTDRQTDRRGQTERP